jgi:hypothetical protein
MNGSNDSTFHATNEIAYRRSKKGRKEGRRKRRNDGRKKRKN